jgi:hypothetical protein
MQLTVHPFSENYSSKETTVRRQRMVVVWFVLWFIAVQCVQCSSIEGSLNKPQVWLAMYTIRWEMLIIAENIIV